jgi:hypothetical protein
MDYIARETATAIPVSLLVETFLAETFFDYGRGRFGRVKERVHLTSMTCKKRSVAVWKRLTYMLSTLAAHTREGGVRRARVDDDGYALRRSTYPKIGVVHTHALEQRSLCPTHGVEIIGFGERTKSNRRSLTCRYSFQTAFSVWHSEYLWPPQGSDAAEESATCLWGREMMMTTTAMMMIMKLRQRYCPMQEDCCLCSSCSGLYP